MKLTEKEKKLAKFFIEREGEGLLTDIRNIDFVDAGIIDSLDMVSLAVFIEKEFGKKLDLSDPYTISAVRKFDTLSSLIGE